MVLFEGAEYDVDIAPVLFYGFGPDHDIVKIYDYVADLAYPLPECIGDASLMNGGRVLESHGHDYPFVETKGCINSCQMYIVGMNVCLEETIGHVNFGPDLTFSTIRQNVVNSWQWVCVEDHVIVELILIIHPMRENRRV
jgi:hypothetical protein